MCYRPLAYTTNSSVSQRLKVHNPHEDWGYPRKFMITRCNTRLASTKSANARSSGSSWNNKPCQDSTKEKIYRTALEIPRPLINCTHTSRQVDHLNSVCTWVFGELTALSWRPERLGLFLLLTAVYNSRIHIHRRSQSMSQNNISWVMNHQAQEK